MASDKHELVQLDELPVLLRFINTRAPQKYLPTGIKVLN